ncbi:hypothetical protein BH10ACI2_BH10ACI2_18380 [soil metagenome]
MMQNQHSNTSETYKTLMLIWAAMLFSQFMFVGLAFFVKPELLKFDLANPLLGDNPTMVMLFAAASVADLILSLVFRKKFLEKSVAEQNIATVQTALIFGCALSEAVSLFGLILAFAFGYQYFYIFSALGVIGIFLHFPRKNDVLAASFKT